MNWMRHIGLWLLMSGITAASVLHAQQTGDTPLLYPYTAVYQLKRNNTIVGKVTTSLVLEQDGGYIYKSVTKPIGLVAAFNKDEITEISQGKIKGSKISPTRYFFHHKRKKRPKLRKLKFDWNVNRVLAHGSKPTWSSVVEPGTQDKASKILAIMTAIPENSGDMNIQVVDKNKLKIYNITPAKSELVTIAGNKFETVKLSEAREGKPVSTRLWLAPDLNYLPVKIERKDKKATYTMTLSRFTRE